MNRIKYKDNGNIINLEYMIRKFVYMVII